MSPRDCLLHARNSNRDTLGEEFSRRRCAEAYGAGSPSPGRRSNSPTFRVSEDWMAYSASSPCSDLPVRQSSRTPATARAGGRLAAEGGEVTAAREVVDSGKERLMMPSSNFARAQRRGHSGRITQNSENWATVPPEEAKQAPHLIANSENHRLSRGKKVNLAKDPENAKRRLRMDSSQLENGVTQRRHEFREQSEQLRDVSPRSASQFPVGAAVDAFQEDSQCSSRPCGLVYAQQRTSAEMVATIMPGTQALVPDQCKYLVGGEIVDWQSNGRRQAGACAHHAVQVGMPAKMMSMAKLRDHRNSDLIRDHLQQRAVHATGAPPPPMRATGAPPPSVMHAQPHLVAAREAAVPTSVPTYVYAAPVTTGTTEPHVHSFGGCSMLPSTTSKDAAYTHSGLNVVKYGTRSPGAFSPNMQRTPVSKTSLSL